MGEGGVAFEHILLECSQTGIASVRVPEWRRNDSKRMLVLSASSKGGRNSFLALELELEVKALHVQTR
jgi:hypothetical protein